MNCASCDTPLKPYQFAQATTVAGEVGLRRLEPSFCDDCLRGHKWQGGSQAAIERLLTGEIDSEEQARLDAERVPLWDSGELPELARIDWKAALPESLRPPFNS